jgi:AAHS family 4-hydroxybenzoate transporter-like MFS transporter
MDQLDRRPISEAIDHQRFTTMQLGVVALALLTLIIDGLDVQVLSLVAPVIIDDWGTSRAAFGPALAAALAGMAVGSALGGWLGDRYGRRKTLLVSVALFGLFTFSVAISANVSQLAILRFMSGIGFGAALPSAFALATEWSPARLRTRVLTILTIGVPSGGMLGAPLTLLLLPSVGWRGCFIVCGIITLVILLAMIAKLPESPAYLASTGREDLARELVSRSLKIAPIDVGSDEKTANSPKQTIFSSANIRMNTGIWMAFFFTSAMTYSIAAWTPILLTGNGFEIEEAIKSIFYFNLTGILSCLLSSFAINRLGSRLVLSISLAAAMALILVTMMVVGSVETRPTADERSLVVALLGALGAAAGFAMAANYSILSLGYPALSRSSGIGAGVVAGRLGAIAMVVSGGVLIEASPEGWLLLALLAGACGVALVGALVVDRHIPPLSVSAPLTGRSGAAAPPTA